MFKYIRNKKGWILVDSLIGMVVVATAICALAVAYVQSTKANTASAQGTYGTYYAQRTLEDLKKYDGKSAIILPSRQTEIRDSIEYTIVATEITVSEISSASGLNTYLKPVLVTVSWMEKGLAKSVSMTGYYYLK